MTQRTEHQLGTQLLWIKMYKVWLTRIDIHA